MMHLFAPNSPSGRWLAFSLDALLISILWGLCAVLVIPAGAATAALHQVARSWMRHRSGCDVSAYLRAIRDNFKKATILWVLLLIPLAVIGGNVYALFQAGTDFPAALRMMIFLSVPVWIAAATYAFALQGAFENSPGRTLLNGIRLALGNLLTTIVVILVVGFGLVCTWLFPYGYFLYFPAGIFFLARSLDGAFRRALAWGAREES